MIDLSFYRGKKVGILGLGKAGEATLAAFQKAGAEVFAWDDKETKEAPPLVHYEKWPWHALSALVLSPGIPLTHPKPHASVVFAKENNVPIIGDVELLSVGAPDAYKMVITGTNGKSTTTTLLGHILQEAGLAPEVGGNLGTAALSLKQLGKEGTYVIEASSYQLDLLQTAHFNLVVFLNITPDHIDRHGSLEGYITAKEHAFERQTKDDIAIIAVDDEYTKAISAKLKKAGKSKVIEVSCKSKADIYVENGMLIDGTNKFDISNIESLTGHHNWQNAAASYAAAKARGVAPEVIYKALQSFGGLRHRLQLVDTIGGVRFINDSKATNADAVQHALAPYENIYWIAGGKAKEGGIESLKHLFPHIARAYLIGDAAEMFAKTLGGVPHVISKTLNAAVSQAAADAWKEKKKGAVVLLSPACASFDQFKSFEHRGDSFCDLVKGLKLAHAS
jgi:UDP-N-acetylmuramoylalanine--D-glutamate ligase